jgi:hypothetical protein
LTRLGRHLAVLAGYAALALLYTIPLLRHWNTAFPGVCGEVLPCIWNLWHFRYSVDVLQANPLWTDLQYWPYGANLLLQHSIPFNSTVGYFLVPLLGLPATYNLFFLTSFILAGWGIYLLLTDWGVRPLAAFAAGIFFAFSPAQAAYLETGRGIEFTSLHALPFFVWALSRTIRGGSLRDAVFAALALTWVWCYNYYYFLSCLLLIPLFWLALSKPLSLSFVRRAAPAPWAAGVLNLCLLLAAAWMIAGMARGQTEFHGRGSPRELLLYVAPYLFFWAVLGGRLWLSWRPDLRLNIAALRWEALAPYVGVSLCWAALNWPLIWAILFFMTSGDYGAPLNRWRGGGSPTDLGFALLPNLYNPWIFSIWRALGGLREYSLGWAAPAAALWLWTRRPKDRWASLWFAGFAASFVLMLGPSLKIFGWHLYLPLPFYFLHLLPAFSNITAGHYFNVMTSLFLALLLGRALHALGSRRLILAATILLALECYRGTSKSFTIEMPGIVERLRERPDGAILYVPVSAYFHLIAPADFIGKEFLNGLAAQIAHQKPHVGGTMARVARRTHDQYVGDPYLSAILSAQDGGEPEPRLSDPSAMRRYFTEWRLRYVLTDEAPLPAALKKALKRWPMREIDREGSLLLYEITRR